MPGRTIHLGENPNDFGWAIPNGKGRAFERLVHSYLKRYVATKDGRVKILPTRATGDAGRDFEVHFSGEIELFSFRVAPPAGSVQGVAFIECKSTEHERLDDEFIVDASQHRDAEACSYVLVTNAVLTPYCQYRAQQEWKRRDSTFRMVDRRRLVDELHFRGLGDEAKRLGLPLPNPSDLPAFDRNRLVVSCQTEQIVSVGVHVANVYVAMNNYGSESVFSELSIATDLQWLAEGNRYERVITPGIGETIELIAERQEFDGPADLDLTLSVNGRSQRLAVSRPNYAVAFEPPFTGSAHRNIARDIQRSIEASSGFALISVQGEAGVGKTRTVKEALAPFTDGQFHIFPYHFSRHQGAPSFEDFRGTFGVIGERAHILDPSGRLSDLIQQAASTGVPVLIHFEDLHHADEGVIKVFKQLALRPPICAAPLILVVTGRDDHTFPNEEYYSFLQLLNDQTLGNVHNHLIQPLTDEDAHLLIRSVVQDMPDIGVTRVHALGQNNPFIIVEVLQYLLDTGLAQLLSRRTVGILNPEVFASRTGLPATVVELYERRLAALAVTPIGRSAAEFLVVASFFGFVIDPDVRRTFFDGEEAGEECWALLCERRFVREDATNNELTFAHENLLHHVRRMARRAENAAASAAELLDRPGLVKRLNALDLAEAYYLHEDFSKAFEHFAEIWKRVQSVTNFSSEEIDKHYFAYLPALFETAVAVGAAKTMLSRTALAYGYMGVHNFPLMVGEEACSVATEMLNRIYPEGEGLRAKVAVQQLRAHALQNMGRTGQALKEMLELEATLEEASARWPEVEFDLFDRLQEYYRKANHAKLVHSYGRRARKSVERAGDEKLFAAHLITQSLVCLFSGKQEARRMAAEAKRVCTRAGIRRFTTYTRLTELVIETLYSHQDPAVLNDISAEARSLLRDAAVASFSDSIMRLELLLGTLALNCCEDPRERYTRARFYIDSGQANSIRFGNGLFDWAFDNLAAVIDIEDPSRSDEDVRGRFRSCLERLKKRGLTFLGAQNGLYPNTFAISNSVRFFSQFKESLGVEIIRSMISTYDNRFLDEDRISLDLVRSAAKGQPLFWPPKSRFKMLRFPVHNGYFTPVF